ncbi:hypothetical protein D3C74_458750 [compost metagenome]
MVMVRLYWPAVCISNSISCFFKSLLKFGNWAITPMEPTMAKGAASILSATQAIM